MRMKKKIHVLYVDDDPHLLEIGKLYLEKGGQFTVDTLLSAIIALERLTTEQYDAIISDYQMPDMDGIQFLKQIKASGNTTPFIIFTGRGREEVIIEALNEGADFYLQKGGDLKSQFADLSNKIRYAVKQKQTESALRESEEKFREIFDTINDGIHIQEITPDGKPGGFIEVNEVACRMLHFSRDEMVRHHPYDFSEGSYNKPSQEILSELSTIGHSIYETNLLRKDGALISVEINSHKVRLQGTWVYVSVVRDITSRKESEAALRESEDRFRTLATVALDGIMIHENGIIVDCNHQFLELFGYEPEDIIGKNGFEFILTPESRDDIIRWSQGGSYGTLDIIGITRDGARFYGETSSTSIYWQGKKRSIFQIRNITARKESEQLLLSQKYELNAAYEQISASEEELRFNVDELKRQNQTLKERETQLWSILESTADGILAVDNSGTILHTNQRFVEMWKVPPHILDSRDDRALLNFALDQVVDPDTFLMRVIKLYESSDVDRESFECKDNRVIERYSIPMIMDDSLIGRVWSFRDVTIQKQAKTELQESRHQLNAMATNIPGVVYRFYVNSGGTIGFDYISERSNQILGLDNDLDQFFDTIIQGIVPEDQERFHRSMQNAISTRSCWEFEGKFRKPSGVIIWLSILCSPTIEYEQLIFDGVIFDISEGKSLHEKMYRNNRELFASSEHITTDQAQFSHTPEIASGSEQNDQMSERTSPSIVQSISLGYPEQYRRQLSENLIQRIQNVISTQSSIESLELSGDDVGCLNGEASCCSIASGDQNTGECTSADFRQSKETLHEINQKLRLLTGLTRHDIFNQITVIQGSHELAIKESDPATIHEYISHAQQACERIETMVGFTREYEEFGIVSSGWQRIHSIIEVSKNEVSLGDITIDNRISPDLEVFADPIIRKVFTTLLENAIRHGGCITSIRFTSYICQEALFIVCQDDGRGVAGREKKYIFNHGHGKNTGIGLFLASEILSITGLSIQECGEEGKGARFEIRVPDGKFRIQSRKEN